MRPLVAVHGPPWRLLAEEHGDVRTERVGNRQQGRQGIRSAAFKFAGHADGPAGRLR